MLVLPPVLFAPVEYYAAMWHAQEAVIDLSMPFDKRHKSAHRFTIADTRGALSLTVPIVKPHGRATWHHVAVSSHGEWWRTMRIALESAYGRTPYFEFVFYRFEHIFSEPHGSVADLIIEADEAVRHFLLIDTPVSYTPPATGLITHNSDIILKEYHQIRADRLGFIPSLSVLDLIFNLGPEATLYLKNYYNNA